MTDSGYEGQSKTEEEEKLPPPESRTWRLERQRVGMPDTIYISIEVDGEVLGMIRVPNAEHLIWLREKLQK